VSREVLTTLVLEDIVEKKKKKALRENSATKGFGN